MSIKENTLIMLKRYFFYTGLLGHIVLIIFIVLRPDLVDKVSSKILSKYYTSAKASERNEMLKFPSLKQEIEAVFSKWQPSDEYTSSNLHFVNGKPFESLQNALKSLKDGDTLEIAQGVYSEPFEIHHNRLTIVGKGHVVFENAAIRGKGYIVNYADDLTVKNIECRGITVGDRNGACIRQEGANLTLEHVYFHSSENGVLEATSKTSRILIYDSRFEQLGRLGRAHGIYTNTAELYIYDSMFIASKSEGHEIKSRGAVTEIHGSIIASLSGVDSRLLDVPNGGKLVLSKSLLQQGAMSSNGQAIGYAQEGRKHTENSITLRENVFIFDRIGYDSMLATDNRYVETAISQNIIVGEVDTPELDTSNLTYESREKIGFPEYPFLPNAWCAEQDKCLIRTISQ